VYVPGLSYQRILAFAEKGSHSGRSCKEDVKRLQRYWRRLQRTRNRDAIYGFLAEVFELVEVENKEADKSSRAFKRFRDPDSSLHREPFAIMLATAATPDIIDRRTRSKWSRVLRYASECKWPSELFVDFVKRKGGLNACAALYTRRLGRRRKRRNKSA
jgi:hypothetical protein